jgi:hypothetical protein
VADLVVTRSGLVEVAHLGELGLIAVAQVPDGGDERCALECGAAAVRAHEVGQIATHSLERLFRRPHPAPPAHPGLQQGRARGVGEQPVAPTEGLVVGLEPEALQVRQVVGLGREHLELMSACLRHPPHLQQGIEALVEAAAGTEGLGEQGNDVHGRVCR